MLIMLIPTFIVFKSLGRYVCKGNKISNSIIQFVRYFTFFSIVISVLMMILGGYPNLGMQSTFDLYQTVFWIVYVYTSYKLLDILLGVTFNSKTTLTQIRSLIETIDGDTRRSGIRYWLKGLLAAIAFISFILCMLLSFNIHSERITDIWGSVLYKGVNILGINVIPLIDVVESLSILVLVYCAAKFIVLFVNKKILPYTKLDISAQKATIAVINYVFIIIAMFLFIKSLGISNTVITFIVSGLSVGLGFAMKDLVSDFLSGLVMLFERPVRIGDYVKVNDEMCVVKNIRIRATEVLTFNNDSMIVPNSMMMNQIISNETLDPVSRLVLPIRISYQDDFKKALRICENAVKIEKQILSDPEPTFLLSDYGESALEITIRAYCLREYRIFIISDLRKRVITDLQDSGINISLNKMDISMNNIKK
jgi:small-conductance mechanosensitive channel